MSDHSVSGLDGIDRQLIAALQINARESIAVLARTLGIARTTVATRLARLEQTGTIMGYGLRLSENLVNSGIQAYIGITVQPRAGKDVITQLAKMAQVQQVFAVSGEFDYVAWTRSEAPEQLDKTLDQIGCIEGVVKTTTSIILSKKLVHGMV